MKIDYSLLEDENITIEIFFCDFLSRGYKSEVDKPECVGRVESLNLELWVEMCCNHLVD